MNPHPDINRSNPSEEIPVNPTTDDQPPRPDRRSVMRGLLGVAAGAAVAAVALDPGDAAAQTGAMQYGAANNSGIDTTTLIATVAGGRSLSVTNLGANGFGFAGEAATVYGGHGTSFGVHMTSDDTGIDVFGLQTGMYSQARYGIGVRGYSEQSYGLMTQGGKADAFLGGTLPAPIVRTDAHVAGELTRDTDGAFWACVANGVPGTWRKLAGASTAGSLHPIEPTRVYDSRWPSGGGLLVNGASRRVDVSAGRNLTSGAIEAPDLVPVNATALQYTITVADTVGSGFVAVTSAGATTYRASSINWSTAGQSSANSTMGKLTSPELRLWGGGGGSTQVIIDVLGYYL